MAQVREWGQRANLGSSEVSAFGPGPMFAKTGRLPTLRGFREVNTSPAERAFPRRTRQAAVINGNFRTALSIPRTSHQAPRLAIDFEARLAPGMRIKPQPDTPIQSLDRDHIPCILRHNVGHDEIDVFFCVGGAIAGSSHLVTPVEVRLGGLNLYPPAARAGVHNEVKLRAVSPGFGYIESKVRSLAKERRLSRFPLALARVPAKPSDRAGCTCRFILSFHAKQKGAASPRLTLSLVVIPSRPLLATRDLGARCDRPAFLMSEAQSARFARIPIKHKRRSPRAAPSISLSTFRIAKRIGVL